MVWVCPKLWRQPEPEKEAKLVRVKDWIQSTMKILGKHIVKGSARLYIMEMG